MLKQKVFQICRHKKSTVSKREQRTDVFLIQIHISIFLHFSYILHTSSTYCIGSKNQSRGSEFITKITRTVIMAKTHSCMKYRYSTSGLKLKMQPRRRSKRLKKKVHFDHDTKKSECTTHTRHSAVRNLFPKKSLLELPNEIVSLILTYFNVKDLMTLRCVSQQLLDLIDGNSTIWARVSYQNLWPTTKSEHEIFQRGANCRNLECLTKLGLSYLYHYHLISGAEKNEKLVNYNATLAATYLNHLDTSIAPSKPLTWMLIRPPWPAKSICLKQAIHKQMVQTSSSSENGAILYNIGRVIGLDTTNTEHAAESTSNLSSSAELGCTHATFQRLQTQNVYDMETGRKLQWFRDLKECAMRGNWEAEFMLARVYIRNNKNKCIPENEATAFCHELFAKSLSVRTLELHQPKINNLMRCILIDWLAEVAYMKGMSHQVVHAAVQYVDKYLSTRVIERTKLQLLGITCLLLAAKSHFDPKSEMHILTVRESSWLTDQTYEYEDVVRMMGEIIGTFKGVLWTSTSWEYLNLMHSFAEIDEQTKLFSHYLHDMSLQFSCFRHYKPSLLAVSTIFLSRVILNNETPWLSNFQQFTGFAMKDVANCASVFFYKCITCPSVKDDRDLPLQSIREEYQSSSNQHIANTDIPTVTELKARILNADCTLTCVSHEPLVFEYISLDETLNRSTLSVDYDGDCESGILSDSSSSEDEEESFSVGRTRFSSYRSVDDFSDDDTTMESLNYSRDNHTPIFNSFKNSLLNDLNFFPKDLKNTQPLSPCRADVSIERSKSGTKRKSAHAPLDPICKRTRSSSLNRNY